MGRRPVVVLGALAALAGCAQDAADPSVTDGPPTSVTGESPGDARPADTSAAAQPTVQPSPTEPTAEPSPDSEETPVEATPLFSAEHTAIGDAFDLAIRDEGAWHETWDEINASRQPTPDAPAFDFDQNMVLVVAIGERPSGGYAVEITDVRQHDDVVLVTSLERIPGRECAVTRAITSPVAAVTVPHTDGDVTFVHETETYACPDPDEP